MERYLKKALSIWALMNYLERSRYQEFQTCFAAMFRAPFIESIYFSGNDAHKTAIESISFSDHMRRGSYLSWKESETGMQSLMETDVMKLELRKYFARFTF